MSRGQFQTLHTTSTRLNQILWKLCKFYNGVLIFLFQLYFVLGQKYLEFILVSHCSNRKLFQFSFIPVQYFRVALWVIFEMILKMINSIVQRWHCIFPQILHFQRLHLFTFDISLVCNTYVMLIQSSLLHFHFLGLCWKVCS